MYIFSALVQCAKSTVTSNSLPWHFLLLSYWVRINSALAWAGFGDWRVRPCFVCHGRLPEEIQLFPLPQQTGGLSWEPQCRISATHDVRTAMMSSHSSSVCFSSPLSFPPPIKIKELTADLGGKKHCHLYLCVELLYFFFCCQNMGNIGSLTNEAWPWPRVSHFRKHESAAYNLTAEQYYIAPYSRNR